MLKLTLTILLAASAGHASAGRMKTSVLLESLSTEATAETVNGGTCDTPKCNPTQCPDTVNPTFPGVVTLASSAMLEKGLVASPYCISLFGQEHCCREKYADGIFYRQSTNHVPKSVDPCSTCTPITAIAGNLRVHFMRHAEGCHNMESSWRKKHTHKVFGEFDSPLTTNGLAQARLARATVGAIHIDHILVSPMRRAQMTAAEAIEGTRHGAMHLNVVNFANERGRGINPENTPTSPVFQTCLMDADADVNGLAALPNIDRCVDYHLPNLALSTCHTNGDGIQTYSEDAKAVNPQYFADWLTMLYANREVFLVGHSNWAKDAGLMSPQTHDANGDPEERVKVDWASIYEFNLMPGRHIKDATAGAQQVFAGTPKTQLSKSPGVVQDNARCQADVGLIEACKGVHGAEWYKGL